MLSGLDEKGRRIKSLTDHTGGTLEREDLKHGSRKGKRKMQRMVGGPVVGRVIGALLNAECANAHALFPADGRRRP